eukprot:scaffold103103_cov67-Phaeocystis_antarctica.AAC.3
MREQLARSRLANCGMLPWSSRGFCGVTERTKGSSCGGSADLKGSWAVSPPADASYQQSPQKAFRYEDDPRSH